MGVFGEVAVAEFGVEIDAMVFAESAGGPRDDGFAGRVFHPENAVMLDGGIRGERLGGEKKAGKEECQEAEAA